MRKTIQYIFLNVVVLLLAQLQLDAQIQLQPSYLSVAEGVASPSVTGVLQDSYGLIWISTQNGLQKYDGYRFETFKNNSKPTSLQHNQVWGIAEDSSHSIWLATETGISRYDRKKNEFVNYVFSMLFPSKGLAAGRAFNFMIDSRQRIWAQTSDLGLIWYDAAADTWKLNEMSIPNTPNPIRTGPSMGTAEDKNGTIWSSSAAYGLLRQTKGSSVFKPVPTDGFNGIDFTKAENTITDLYFDANNILWIAARNGVFKYNQATQKLTIIVQYTEDLPDIMSYWNYIQPDQEGNIWIANNFRGLLKFDGISDRYQNVLIDGALMIKGLGWNVRLTKFMIDKSGIFWFGTMQQGLLKYNPVSKPFTAFKHNAGDPKSISPNGVFGLMASTMKPGIVYVGSRGHGLNVFDSRKKTFQNFRYKAVDDFFGGSVRSIGELKDGSLLLGSWGDGLIQTNQQYQEVKRHRFTPGTPTSISNNQVRVIKPASNGKFWIGTENGLNLFTPETGHFERIESSGTRTYPKKLYTEIDRLVANQQQVARIDSVVDFGDRSASVAIPTAGNYLVFCVGEGDFQSPADFGWIENEQKDTVWEMRSFHHTRFAGGAFKNRVAIEKLSLPAGNYTVRYVADDSHSFGKWNDDAPDETPLYGISLIRLTKENEAALLPLLDQSKQPIIINGSSISDVEVGRQYTWVAARDLGLTRIDPATQTSTHYLNDRKAENSIASNLISDVHEDGKGFLWIATPEGLNRLDPRTEKFRLYTTADGLPTNLTESILPGENGELWIGTQFGLSQMIPNEALDKVTFINYSASDGLSGDVSIPLVASKSKDGQFYFGSDQGLTSFGKIHSNNTPPSIILSNLLLSNQSVLDMKDKSPLTTSLADAKEIQLAFNQNNLSFEFAALHYANPEKNLYAHILKGYDKDWVYDNRNFATYTNLDPGKYEFVIRASNAYGIWNEEGKSIFITILPPWWKTWWAYTLYALLLAGIVYSSVRIMQVRIKEREREKNRKRALQQAKEIEKAYTELKATQAQLIQSEKMASLGELTAGIAHEIQNPLNFVNNFADINTELADELTAELESGNLESAMELAGDIKANSTKIRHHGKRADDIVKGMLQHSRAGSGTKEPTDINALCDEYLRLSYHGLRAKDKSFNVSYETSYDAALDKIAIVPQDVGRVLLNLYNNAFYAVFEKQKATDGSYKPTVSVTTSQENGSVKIVVKDNGNGMPQQVKEKIFQPFFTTKPTGEGTGLGLSLSYDIIKAHGGTIAVTDNAGGGAVFTIHLNKQAI